MTASRMLLPDSHSAHRANRWAWRAHRWVDLNACSWRARASSGPAGRTRGHRRGSGPGRIVPACGMLNRHDPSSCAAYELAAGHNESSGGCCVQRAGDDDLIRAESELQPSWVGAMQQRPPEPCWQPAIEAGLDRGHDGVGRPCALGATIGSTPVLITLTPSSRSQLLTARRLTDPTRRAADRPSRIGSHADHRRFRMSPGDSHGSELGSAGRLASPTDRHISTVSRRAAPHADGCLATRISRA